MHCSAGPLSCGALNSDSPAAHTCRLATIFTACLAAKWAAHGSHLSTARYAVPTFCHCLVRQCYSHDCRISPASIVRVSLLVFLHARKFLSILAICCSPHDAGLDGLIEADTACRRTSAHMHCGSPITDMKHTACNPHLRADSSSS